MNNLGNKNDAANNDYKAGLRKIKDIEKPCLDPEHNPPSHIVLDPGIYEYICPSCGKTIRFSVPYIT